MNRIWIAMVFMLMSCTGPAIDEIDEELERSEDYPLVCSGDGLCFDVELAISREEQMLGLMHRKEMAKEHGMLFMFPSEGHYPFWMKNTHIPLDIIWIDRNKTIVHIERDAQPCGRECPTIDPGTNASYVLEVYSGQADNMTKGDVLEFNI